MAPTIASTITQTEQVLTPGLAPPSFTPSMQAKSNPPTHFEQQNQFFVDPQSTILVSKYKSPTTGLTVVHVDLDSKSILMLCESLNNRVSFSNFKGPLVSGFLTVATEGKRKEQDDITMNSERLLTMERVWLYFGG